MHQKNVSNIFKAINKNTRTMLGASIVNFEHTSHFILPLILLNFTVNIA